MLGVKCAICNKNILQADTVVRVLAEVIQRADITEKNVDQFSSVLDWQPAVAMHLRCVRRKKEQNCVIPYDSEISALDLFELPMSSDIDDDIVVSKNNVISIC